MTDKIILAGNPNVGKTTLFNALTGLRQHTGNWAGKTVGSASGYAEIGDRKKLIIDTPGTYSLSAASPDEALARDCICLEECDCIVVVCDACSLERSLFLALQIMERRSNVIVCVNLIDEAEKRGIRVDLPLLSRLLACPVVGISAARGINFDALLDAIKSESPDKPSWVFAPAPAAPLDLKKRASEIAAEAVSSAGRSHYSRLDRLLCHPVLAWPIMAALLLFVLWLSISAANLPSELLSRFFAFIGGNLYSLLEKLLPQQLVSALMDGVYNTTVWVISVMLPPMAVFFPLFTLLEDWGLLPRVAFNMDCIFKKCGSCGKQALTMCMGLGCNAVGVTGCRIIAGRREKLIAILTNSFMPCNGRFPGIMLMAALLFPGSGGFVSAAAVLGVISIGAGATFISSKILSFVLPEPTAPLFTLELPPFRRPKIAETLLRSVLDHTLTVLLRALKAAAPAGLLIWLLANTPLNGESLLGWLRSFLQPAGEFFGLDGAILLGFVLGFPANEIVLPAIMMCYVSGSSLAALPPISELAPFLAQMGWTHITMLSVMLFTLFHWPCATSLITVKKECGSLGLTVLAALLPTLWGLVLCFVLKLVM